MRQFLVLAIGFLLLVSFVPAVSAEPEPDDFSVSVSPTSASVQRGSETMAIVIVTGDNYDLVVSLMASGQPSGVSVSFSQSSGVPPFSSTMTINVSSNVPAENYTITVEGTGTDNKNHTCPYALTVTQPELGTLSVALVSLDPFDITLILPGLPFAPTTIAPGFNLIYVTDSETGEPVDADVTLSFFTLGLWGGTELDPMLMFMMLQSGGGFGGLFGMGLEVSVTDGMGVLFLPEGVEFARATVSPYGDYNDFGFFIRIAETGETEAAELSVSVPGDPTAGLVGISVNVDGEPAENADVYVDDVHQGKTDAEGNCTVALEKGSHTILVKHQGLEQSAGVTAWEARNTHIELQKAQVSIGDAVKGKLVDEYGNPVPSASVVLGGQPGLTGADGGFELSTEGVEAGTHSVISEHRFDSAAYVSYASSSANIEITLGGTPWWQYVVAIIIFLIILRVGLFARRRIKKLPVRPERPPGATEA